MDLLLSPTSKVLNMWFEVVIITLSNTEVIVICLACLRYWMMLLSFIINQPC